MKKKKLGLFSAVAVCVGLIVATSCLVSLGTGVGLSGAGFLLPLGIAVILNIFVAMSFGELHSVLPKVEGGMGQYTAAAIGPAPSIISVISAYVLCMALAGAAEAAMCGIVFTEAFAPGWNPGVISAVITGLLLLANIRGIDIFSKIQNVTVTLLIGSLIVMGILSFFKLGTGEVITAAEQAAAPISDFGGLASLAALAFWLFIGVEFVIPVSNDMKNPKRDVLLAMVIGLVVLFVVQGILGVGMTNYVLLSDLAAAPMPHLLFAEKLLGDAGLYWMGAITVLAAVSTLNTVLASCTRIMAGMGQENMLPKFFAAENKKKVPYAGILMLAGIIIVSVLSGLTDSSQLITLILTGSCFWLISYIITHINVLVLRKKYPEIPRSKKLKFFGIPQVVGIAGCIYMIANISPDPAQKALIFQLFGYTLAALTLFTVIWVKVVMKKKLFAPEPVAEFVTRQEPEVIKGASVPEEA